MSAEQKRAIFSSDHFASMQGVTNGDWTHGLLHPDQMIGERCLADGTGNTSTVHTSTAWPSSVLTRTM